MKYILFFVFSLFISIKGFGQAQIFSENFQSGGGTFTLNGVGPGSNTGLNEWIVDTNYFGGGVYPNTTNEDSTFGGSISFAPYSSYLHIYDVPSGHLNENYNPSNASDRFAYTTNSVCALGLSNVTLNFFYMGQGSATAYGQTYYSRNGGPWTAIGPQLNGRHKWQYATITDPQFNDAQLNFGFRWVNNAGAGKDTSSLGIDDIIVTAQYDSIAHPITGSITNITGTDTVCPGQFIELQYTLSDTMCDAEWTLEMSDGSGSFTSPTGLWAGYNGPSYGYTTLGYWFIDAPSPLATGSCYRFKMTRSSWPFITIYDSVCLVVKNCPTSIITMQPAVTLDTNAVCAGSVIDVPFLSSGTFASLNVYYAELSDSAGNFLTYDTLGSLISNLDYTGPPGSISGQIPLHVKNSCHYYVRVVADTPTTTGSIYGPFCIQHCDIETNGDTSIQACVWSCYKGPAGFNYTMDYRINRFDSNEHYHLGNKFEVQLLNSQFFTLVNNSALGVKVDTVSSKMTLHVPCADSLTNIYGISPGLYYMRIIATKSNMSDSTLGTLVHLTIGEPSDSLVLSIFPTFGPYCLYSIIDISASPNRYMFPPWNSTYTWWESSSSGLYQFPRYPYGDLSLYLNGSQTFQVICQENNYGCLGPKETLTDSVKIQGPPSVTSLNGPKTVCLGDTGVYSVTFTQNTFYQWTVTGKTHTDTANNQIKIKFDSVETVTVKIHASDSCFPDENDSMKVKVIAKPLPAISASPSATVCDGTPITLSASGGSSYKWGNGSRSASITVTPLNDTICSVGVSNAGCTIDTTIKITINPIPKVNVIYCVGDSVILNASGAKQYTWAPTTGFSINDSIARGLISSVETFTVTGTTNNCTNTFTFTVNPNIKSDTITSAVAINVGQSVQLLVQGGYSWLWYPSTGLSNDTIKDPVASPSVTTVYYVVIKNRDGCSLIDTVTVDVESFCNVFIPNVFSPSDPSNHNTKFHVRSECLISVDLSIFDRWGIKVYESQDISQDATAGWDGTYKGEALNPGTFIYYATGQTSDGKTFSKKGNVTLVR